jgi:sugar/nucleoside kinase (ribokinase family)
MLDVLLPSAYFCDLVFTGLPDIPKLGDEVFSQGLKVVPGAGFIPAVALTRLGLQVGWSCDFGNDFFSRFVLEEARRQNLSSDLFRIHDRPLQAVSVAYSFAGDRAFLSYIDPLPATDLIDLLHHNPARCLMLTSLQTGSGFRDAARTAHAQDTLIFMDGQVMGDADLRKLEVIAALQSVDIFSLNQKEALTLTGEKNIESALERLAELAPTVVIKMGAEGAIAQSKGQRVRMPGIPAKVVDTTGAGDNFDCGFIYGILHRYSLENCLRCGNFCGSRSTASHGGWSMSPTAADLEAYLQKNSWNNY